MARSRNAMNVYIHRKVIYDGKANLSGDKCGRRAHYVKISRDIKGISRLMF